ncbi:MAG: efflux RND transporter periplasmic adaptor subunit [Actinophytocola sp.]|nr:efflux RND transporter periplasmic adaptor subunit [Actinophytocola sp.]
MKRRTLIVGLVVVAVGAGAAFSLAAMLGFTANTGDAAEPSGLPPQTAEVVTTTLRDTGTISGTLGYGDAVPVTATGKGGTITWLAPVGSTVKRGKPLYKVDERPVVALYGKLPLYRELRSGVEGDDVAQLERNLSKLGYAGFTVDEYYTAATAAAVAEWQDDIGQQATGVVMPGEAVFVPSAVRIADHAARVGAVAGGAGGEVLSYTGTAREVVVELVVADQRLAKEGANVTVTVPGGDDVKGKIAEVGTVAATSDDDSSGGGSGTADGGAAEDATVDVIVAITEQQALGDLTGGPVDVTFISSTRKDVLAVPVGALLSLAEGGYGVEVVSDQAGGKTRIVAVDVGLFADGLVEVSGKGSADIAEGTVVGVAS